MDVSVGKAVLFLISEGLMILADTPLCPKARKIIRPPQHQKGKKNYRAIKASRKYLLPNKRDVITAERSSTQHLCISTSKADASLLHTLL